MQVRGWGGVKGFFFNSMQQRPMYRHFGLVSKLSIKSCMYLSSYSQSFCMKLKIPYKGKTKFCIRNLFVPTTNKTCVFNKKKNTQKREVHQVK